MRSAALRSLGSVALIALLSACGNSSSTTTTSSSGTSSAPAAGGTAIAIGIDMPLSGDDASIGVPTKNGVLLAIEEANKAKALPDGFTVVDKTLDDAVQGTHDPAAGAQNVKTFISDGSVLAMVGPFNSNVAQSEIPLTNDAVMVQISPSNTNDGLTTGDNAAKLRTSHPDVNTYFRVCTRDSRQGGALASYAKKLGWKKIYIVDDNETYGKGLADIFDTSFKLGGGTVLGHDHLTKGQQDFKALLTKARAAGPDAVFYGGNTSTGGGLLRLQMADVGMKATPFIGGDGISDQQFITTAGAMSNGSYYSFAAPEASKLASAQTFITNYKARFNEDVGPYSANSYAATKIIIAAIAKGIKDNGGKVPSRADVLKNVQATTNFDTPIGKVGFDKNGDTTAPILTIKKIVDKKAVFVDQIILKS